jgi:hypothetical protein
MTTTRLRHGSAEPERGSQRDEGGLLEAIVGDNVLEALGHPLGPHRVQVRRVWGDNYRVNVLVGPDVVSFVIAHSFFLTADGDGKILTSCPAIARAY